MRKLKQRILAVLLAVSMVAVSAPAVPASVVAEAATQDVITLNTTSLTNWTVGKSGSFYAYVNGARVSNATLNWSSSNTAVATCENGVLKAVGAGTAIITCTKENAVAATCTVTVKGNDVVTLNATSLTNWTVGKTGSFYAYVNGKRVNNATMTWSSSNPAVATCENGVLTAVGAGTAVISCTKAGATTATCTVTVKGNDIVTLNTTSLTNWTVGKTGSFYAYVNGKRVANNTMTWSSSNTAVATCVNGVLTAKGPGTAIISCTKAGATTATCTVTVKGDDIVTLNVSELKDWAVGKTGSFYAYVNGRRVANNTMTWSSSNTAVATCENGVLTAVGAGTATITCTKAGATTATCTVTVKGNDVVTLNVTSLTDWTVGKTGTFYAYVNGRRVANNTMTWSSSNPAVATCVNGVLTAKGPGTAVISCTKAGATTATCTVTVKSDMPATDVSKFKYETTTAGTLRITGLTDKNLTTISVPEYINGKKVTEIGPRAFKDCPELVKLYIPSTVTFIDEWAVAQCYKLEEVVVSGSVKTIGVEAFSNCRALTKLTIQEGVEEIGSSAFRACMALAEVALPQSLKVIGDGAFTACYELESIRIPGNVEKIGSSAFSMLDLSEVILGDGIQEIGDHAFGYCGNLERIEIPDSVKKIGDYAFSSCDMLTELQIGEGVKEIGRYAFAYNRGLTEIVLPDSIVTVGDSAFQYCENVTKIRIPNNNATFGVDAFYSCSEEMVFEVDAQNAYFVLVDGVLFSKDMKKLIQMPGGALVSNYYVPDGVVEICASAFADRAVSKITLPYSLVTIGENAFAHSQVARIHIPRNVSTIGAGAFTGFSMYEITVDSSNPYFKAVNRVLFDKNMTTLLCLPGSGYRDGYTIPDGVTTIGPMAFASNWVERVVIPDSVVTIGKEAFRSSWIKELDLPDSVVTIEDYAFSGCGSLTEVVIPNGVRTIGYGVFDSCYALETITVPASVTEIGMNAFQSGVTIITTRGSYADTYAQRHSYRGYIIQYQ